MIHFLVASLALAEGKSTSATSKTTTMSDTMPTALSADSCIIQLDSVVTEDLQDCKCGDGDEVCTVGQLCHSRKNESGTDVAQCSNRPDPFAPITLAEQCPGSWRQTKVTPTSTTTATPDSTHKPASSTISTTTTTTTTTASSTTGTTPATTTTDSTTTTSTSPTTSTTTSTTITTSTTTTTASTTTADSTSTTSTTTDSTTTADSTSTTSTTTDSTTTADSTTTTTTTTTAVPTVTVVRCGSVICDVGEACKAKGYTQEKKCVVLSCGAGTRGPCQCKSSMCDANSYCHIDLYNTRDPGSCKVIETCPPDVRLTRSEFPKGCTCFDQHCAIESGSSKVCSEDAGCGSRSFKVSAEASSGSSGTLPLLIGGCMAVVGLMFIGVVAMSVMSKRTQLKKNANTTEDQDKDDDLANTSLPPQHAYFADE